MACLQVICKRKGVPSRLRDAYVALTLKLGYKEKRKKSDTTTYNPSIAVEG